jgi:hypothetical protein
LIGWLPFLTSFITNSTYFFSSASSNSTDSVNSLYLKIGDKEYNFNELKPKYRNPTDIFNVTIADNGIFAAVKGGPTKAAADGYYVITEPLQKGNYTVHYKASLYCPGEGCLETNFVQDINYTITAE